MYVIILLKYKNEVVSNSEKESNEIKISGFIKGDVAWKQISHNIPISFWEFMFYRVFIMQINKQINACI